MKTICLALLFILSGCGGYTGSPATPRPVATVMDPQPLHRYQIKYQNRGLKLTPDFAGVDRNGEYVLVPNP